MNLNIFGRGKDLWSAYSLASAKSRFQWKVSTFQGNMKHQRLILHNILDLIYPNALKSFIKDF